MKKLLSILLSFVMVFSLVGMSNIFTVNAVTNEETWKATAVITPEEGALEGAGYINIKFDTTLENAKSYTVYFDGKSENQLVDGKAATMTFDAKEGVDTQICEVYSVDVKEGHTAYVVATLESGEKVKSDTRTFYISKKGLAIGGDMSETVEIGKLNLSWYYNWASTAFNSSVDKGVAHVPMVWGIGEDNIEGIADITDDSNYILGYNEPDIESQANATPAEGLEVWPLITATGKRTVSPAASNPNGASTWLTEFLEGTDVDAVALHCYGGRVDINILLRAVNNIWEAYHKPIWVTEVSIMGVKGVEGVDHSFEKEGEQELMAEYVKQMVEAFDDDPRIERYAWFPYNIQSANEIDGLTGCGATAMFDYESGKFTNLGLLYSQIGNPEGYDAYQITEDEKYIYVESTTEPTTVPQTTKNETTTTVAGTTKTSKKTKKPARVKIKQAKNNKKKVVSLKWTKTANAKKYQVQYSLNKKFKTAKKYKTKTFVTKKVQYTVKKLTKNKTYYFRVRGINSNRYGAWSTTKKVKIIK